MSGHLCHAFDCETPVPPRMFMCARHWRMVPKAMQDAVWAAYTPGQERKGFPSEEAADRYLAATRNARIHVRDLERAGAPRREDGPR